MQENMKVYIVLYQYGLGAEVKKVFSRKAEAEMYANSMNGFGVRSGTYQVVEEEVD